MATSIGQYTPVFLPGEPPSLTKKPGKPQSTRLQRFRHDQSDPARIDTVIKTLFTVKKVETKITHKTIAHYGSMISTGKVNIYESFNTGSGAGSTRESRTITDSQIDDMFKGLM